MQKYGIASVIAGALVGIGIIIAVVLNHVQPAQPSQVKEDANQSSKTAASSDSGVPQDLSFSGEVSGHMTNGRKGDTYACGITAAGPIVGSIDGNDYSFEFRALTAKGPGTYKAYVQVGPLSDKNTSYGSDTAYITINADQRSGKVEGQLHDLKNSGKTIAISGNWNCPPDF